jgi:hypothetical protein
VLLDFLAQLHECLPAKQAGHINRKRGQQLTSPLLPTHESMNARLWEATCLIFLYLKHFGTKSSVCQGQAECVKSEAPPAADLLHQQRQYL